MNERLVLTAILAFAAGVCAMDVAQEWRAPPCPSPAPRATRLIVIPMAPERIVNLTPVDPVPLPAAIPADLACAHWSAIGRGYLCP
jgi:hypothetical protein